MSSNDSFKESINLIFHTATIVVFILLSFFVHYHELGSLRHKLDGLQVFLNQYPDTLSNLTNSLTKQNKLIEELHTKLDMPLKVENKSRNNSSLRSLIYGLFNSVEKKVDHSNNKVTRQLDYIEKRIARIEQLLLGVNPQPARSRESPRPAPTKVKKAISLDWIEE